MVVSPKGRWLLVALLGLTLIGCGKPDDVARTVVYRLIDEEPEDHFDRGEIIATDTLEEWVFRARHDLASWQFELDPGEYGLSPSGLQLSPERQYVTMTRNVTLDADQVDAFELVLKGLRRHPVTVEWAGPGGVFTRKRRITLESGKPAADGFMMHRIVTAGHPEWRGHIARLRFGLNLSRSRHAIIDRIRVVTERVPVDLLASAAARPWKVSLDHDFRNGLLALPGAALRREVPAPEGGSLRLSYGVQPRVQQPVRFTASLIASDGPPEVVLDETLVGGSGWREASVLLAGHGGGTVELELRTSVDGDFDPRQGFPVWANVEVVGHEGTDRPNVVLIVLDTLRSDHLSLYGYHRQTSPHIDSWAREHGMVFENVVASAPWTLPSHVSMFTGLHAHRHGVNHNLSAPTSLPMLAEILRSAGYSTAAVTGGGFVHPQYGFAQGFDSYWVSGVKMGFENELEMELERAFGALDQYKDRPFFLFFHTYEVHNPFRPRQPYLGRFADHPDGLTVDVENLPRSAEDGFVDHRRLIFHRDGKPSGPVSEDQLAVAVDLYDAGIAYADAMVGRLLRRLEELGVGDRTIVVLTSDHGEMMGEHGVFNHVSLFEENLLVPLVVVDPRRNVPMRIPEQVRLVDLTPTVLDLLDLDIPTGLDGVSLLPMTRGEQPPEGSGIAWSYAAASNYGLALRTRDRRKLVIRNDPWPHDGPLEWSYDLTNDPGEQNPSGLPPEVAEVYRRKAWQAAREEIPGVMVRVASPDGGPPVSGRLRGVMLFTDRVKTAMPGPSGMDYGPRKEARFRVEGGEVSEILLTDAGSSITVQLDPWHPGGEPFELEVDLTRLDGVLQLVLGDFGWQTRTADEPATQGLSLWSKLPPGGARSSAPPIDPDLQRQLEALGYVQ